MGASRLDALRQRIDRADGMALLCGALGAAAVLAALLEAPSGVTAAICLLTVAIVVWRALAGSRSSAPVGRDVVPRVLVAVAIAIAASDRLGAAGGVVLALAVVAEVSVQSVSQGAFPLGVRVPGGDVVRRRPLPTSSTFFVNTAALVIAVGMARILPVVILLLAVIALLLEVGMVGVDLAFIGRRRRAESTLTAALGEYSPEFVVHWDAPAGTAFQLSMWLPHLDRLGHRYVVLVRDEQSFTEVTDLTDRPMLLRRTLADLDRVIVPSIRAAFYVNNSMRNAHFVRYVGIRHVMLGHGDSEKTPFYNPASRMYDRFFVAGQAAVDRFASHGVPTAPDFFEIVGRPQVEGIQVGSPGAEVKAVLYAPTWAGHNADSDYSSLPIGPGIVQALLDRGRIVVFRAHPYSEQTPALRRQAAEIRRMLAADAQSTGRPHIFGAAAETERSLIDCFNASDAMIADVSSLVSDFLQSEKPFAVTAMDRETAALEKSSALYAAGLTIAGDGSNIAQVVDHLLADDAGRAQRQAIKAYYLGEPAAGEGHFAAAVGRILTTSG
ncbi:MAG: CDP-glycerol glycerophosphotransferase family protein [Microbacterium sp.]